MPQAQVFCFFVNGEGAAWAYATPNFQAGLRRPCLDALQQVRILDRRNASTSKLRSSTFKVDSRCFAEWNRSMVAGPKCWFVQAAGAAAWERVRVMPQPGREEVVPDDDPTALQV